MDSLRGYDHWKTTDPRDGEHDRGPMCGCSECEAEARDAAELDSPQSRVGCACPEHTDAIGCAERRYGPSTDEDGRAEECSCACHEGDDDGYDEEGVADDDAYEWP